MHPRGRAPPRDTPGVGAQALLLCQPREAAPTQSHSAHHPHGRRRGAEAQHTAPHPPQGRRPALPSRTSRPDSRPGPPHMPRTRLPTWQQQGRAGRKMGPRVGEGGAGGPERREVWGRGGAGRGKGGGRS